MDDQIFTAVNGLARATPWLHGLLLGYANYGVLLFAVLLGCGWWIARRRGSGMPAALWAPAATLLAVAVNQPIVAAVSEPRPYTVLPNLLVLATPSTDPSFPSDHATMAGAVAAGLWLVERRLGVVAGFTVGASMTLLGYLLVRPLLIRLVLWLEHTRWRPLLTPVAVGEFALSASGR